jgi:hypothetical protein
VCSDLELILGHIRVHLFEVNFYWRPFTPLPL